MNNHETENSTITKKAKLIFKIGSYRNEKLDVDDDKFISKFDGRIVYADINLDLRTGVSYTCDLKLSPQGKAYEVMSAVKTPVVTATLIFRRGKRKYNEATNDYVENMVSTFDGEIVIAPKTLQIEPHKEYSVDMVLSPNGRAYIAEEATPIEPQMHTAEIIAHESPISIVDVIIDGDTQEDLRFDCMGGDEKMLQSKIHSLRQKNIADKDMVASNYEAKCRDLMTKHLSRLS